MSRILSAIPDKKEVKPLRSMDLWFRADRKHKVASRQFKSTIRFGNREFGTQDPKGGYALGDIVLVKIQNPDGSFDEWTTKIIITAIDRRHQSKLSEFFLKSFETKEDLANYYGEVAPNQEFTVIGFEYLEDIDSVSELVRFELLKFAKLPPNNPQEIGANGYTIPLIEHDYPAKTPVMWNAAYSKFGLGRRNIMLVGEPKNASSILDVLRRDSRYEGGGAGVGFKDESFDHLDEFDQLAEAIGSVNFILKTKAGKLRGYNTDGLGYVMSLENLLESRTDQLAGKKVLILGAGGTANSIAFALAQKQANLVILNRTVSTAENLADRINAFCGRVVAIAGGEDQIRSRALNSDIIINVSTKGATGSLQKFSALAPAVLPVTEDSIRKNLESSSRMIAELSKNVIVSDINLVNGQTPLLEQASGKGLATLDGLPMVINQGVEAFWILYGDELSARGIQKQDVAKVMAAAASGI